MLFYLLKDNVCIFLTKNDMASIMFMLFLANLARMWHNKHEMSPSRKKGP